MPLTLVTGRANAGKTGILYEVVRSAVAEGRRPVAVVPSRPEADRARDEFARYGPVVGVEVATFDEYLSSLWALYGDGRRVVGPTQRRVLLARAIGEVRLKTLERSSRRRGFTRTLERLVQVIGTLQLPIGSSGVAGEMASLVATYGMLLDRAGLVEPAVAANILSRSAQPDWFEGPLVANRFTDLTGAQEGFLVAGGSCSDVWLALPWQEGFAATRALTPLVRRLLDAGASVRPVPDARYTSSEELAYLETHLFSPPDEAIGSPRLGDVRLSRAYGEEAEADRIAAEVLEALGEGTNPSRIAVVFRDPSRFVQPLRQAFAGAGIAAEFDVLDSATHTGWGRALSHLTTFALGGSLADLVAFARVPYSGVTRTSAEHAEAYWRRKRVEAFEDLVEDLGRLGGDAPHLVRLAIRLAKRPVDASTAGEWQNLASRLLRNASPSTRIGASGELAADAAAHRAFTRVLVELVSLPGGAIGVSEMLEAFGDEKITIAVGDISVDRVHVVSAERVRSRRFDVVIVGGLNLGDFPPRTEDDALSTSEIAGVLLGHGVDLRRMDDQDAHRLLFYLVVSRATRRLVLSRQLTDSDGHELRASWLLEELLDLYRKPGMGSGCGDGLPTRTLRLDEQALDDAAPPTHRRALRQLASSGRSLPPGTATADRLAEARRRALKQVGALDDARALAQLSARDVFSVTEIEAYLRCPYAWFYEWIVRAHSLDEGIDPLLTGRLTHDALERVYRLLPERAGDTRITLANLDRVLVLAAEVLDGVLASAGGTNGLLDEAALAAVRERVRGFLEADASFLPGYAPIALEQTFDTRETDLRLPSGIHLRGRIDRVDSGPGGRLVVIDYKTGRVDAALGQANLQKSRRVQLALYSVIAEDLFGQRVVGALYRGVTARNLKDKRNRGFFDSEYLDGPGLVAGDEVGDERRDEIVRDALAFVTEAVSGMRAGAVAPHPLDPSACKHCGARGFCEGESR